MPVEINGWKRALKAFFCVISALNFVNTGRATDALPQAEEVLRTALVHARASAACGERCYLYTKRTLVQTIDDSDHVTDQKVQTKTVQSAPVGPAEATKWSRHFGVNFDEHLVDRYSLTMARRIELGGRPTFEIYLSPKNPSVPTHHPVDRLLNHTIGTIWVDEQDGELAKADLRLTEPVNLSILGAVDDLSFRFERTRTNDGNWLTTRTESILRGRRLLSPVKVRHLTEYTGYKPLSPRQLAND